MSNNFALLTDYLATVNILIVDDNMVARNRLIKVFVDMGAKRANIESVGNMHDAKFMIHDKKPKLVLADYKFRNGSGFELFNYYRKQTEDTEALLILVTSNISQSAVAKAAEEDVDAYILKPYTANSLKENLLKSFMAKMHPSDYAKKILEGKEVLFEKQQLDEAEVLFREALELHPKPSLARFYIAQVEHLRKEMKRAEEEYNEGLSINKIHYKCQIGLYELFMEQEKYVSAYGVVKNIIKYFPANPKRLQDVVRLAIQTENFKDIEYFYDVFKEFDERDELMTNYICAGLYVLAKYYRREEVEEEAIKTLHAISISCGTLTKYFKSVMGLLIDMGHHQEARKVMNRYSKEETKNYKIAKFLAMSFEYDVQTKITEGLALYHSGVKDPVCMQITLQALHESGDRERYNYYLDEASFHWPERFSSVNGLLAA